jgi:hypothetical protein
MKFIKTYIKQLTPLLFCLFGMNLVTAQDLEPHSLSNIPIKGNFAVASYAYSEGNILIDNSLPIEGLNAGLNNFVFAYARTFKMFNRLAKFDMILPYSFGNFSGTVVGIDSSTYRNGFGDPAFRLSLVLIGAKPVSGAEFLKQEQKRFNLGISVRIKPPLGQYNSSKLINLGTNRWGTKFGVVGSYDLNKRWILEGQFNAWAFTQNNSFFNGNTIYQKPLITLQGSITHVFKPGVWLAVAYGISRLGETVVNDVEGSNPQNTSRFGSTFAYKLSRKSSLKFAFTSGVTARYGADFTTYVVAYQFMWFDKK